MEPIHSVQTGITPSYKAQYRSTTSHPVVIEISARVYAEYRQNEPGIPPQTNVLNNTFYYLTLQNDVNPISLIRLEVFFCEPLGR